MYSVLSLAALHVAYLVPSKCEAYTLEAARYHDKALRGFREDINHIGSDNSDAIFANAILSFFYAFLTVKSLPGSPVENANSAARTTQALGSEWIPMIRGVQSVLRSVHDHVRLGPLSVLLDNGNWDAITADTRSVPSDEHFQRIAEIWQDSKDAGVYDEALYLLRKCNAFIAQFEDQQEQEHQQREWGYNRDWSAPFTWVLLVSEEYIILQKQRQPHALIIFAFFGALLRPLDGYWWMKGCGKSIVRAVDECLGPYWSQWTAWPKEILGLD
jgi:hypothetical protein